MNPGNTVAQALRHVLCRLHVPVWNEVFAGLSWAQYCCLDVFSSICTPMTGKPQQLIKYCVNDFHGNTVYWPSQGTWWSYRHWRVVGQREAFHDYGPCIPVSPEFVAQVNQLGIQIHGAAPVLPPETFDMMVQQNPRVFDVAFRSCMREFLREYQKGKGKGKALMLNDSRM